MSDRELIDRLRAYRPRDEWGEGCRHVICDEAADLLASQAAEIERLREALEPFAIEAASHDRPDIADHDCFSGDLYFGELRRAREALQQGQNNE